MLAQFWTSFVIWVYHKSSMTVWGLGRVQFLVITSSLLELWRPNKRRCIASSSLNKSCYLSVSQIVDDRVGTGTSFYFWIFFIHWNNEIDSARSGNSKNVSVVCIALILKKLFITSSMSELWNPNKDRCNAGSILNKFCYLSVSQIVDDRVGMGRVSIFEYFW